MTIVEFLRARYDEDEAGALSWPESRRTWRPAGTRNLRYASGSGEPAVAIDVKDEPLDSWEQIWVRRARAGEAEHIARHDPARVLREVEAKRRIVDRAELVLSAGLNERDPVGPTAGRLLAVPAARQELRLVLRLLAAPYADHSDYDPSWRLAE